MLDATAIAVDLDKEKPPRRPPRKNGPGQLSRAYVMRLYPTAEQASALRQWIGCCRYVWNWTVATQAAARKDTGKKLSPSVASW